MIVDVGGWDGWDGSVGREEKERWKEVAANKDVCNVQSSTTQRA